MWRSSYIAIVLPWMYHCKIVCNTGHTNFEQGAATATGCDRGGERAAALGPDIMSKSEACQAIAHDSTAAESQRPAEVHAPPHKRRRHSRFHPEPTELTTAPAPKEAVDGSRSAAPGGEPDSGGQLSVPTPRAHLAAQVAAPEQPDPATAEEAAAEAAQLAMSPAWVLRLSAEGSALSRCIPDILLVKHSLALRRWYTPKHDCLFVPGN